MDQTVVGTIGRFSFARSCWTLWLRNFPVPLSPCSPKARRQSTLLRLNIGVGATRRYFLRSPRAQHRSASGSLPSAHSAWHDG